MSIKLFVNLQIVIYYKCVSEVEFYLYRNTLLNNIILLGGF